MIRAAILIALIAYAIQYQRGALECEPWPEGPCWNQEEVK